MINFDRLENESDIYRDQFHSASPFSHLVIDDFLTEEAVTAVSALALQTTPLSKSLSSDYVFAKNKIESPRFVEYSEVLAKLSAELMSKRFQRWLSFVGGEEDFLDPSFTGGGIHQGGQGSYLDMHTDFNIHPENVRGYEGTIFCSTLIRLTTKVGGRWIWSTPRRDRARPLQRY